MILDLYLIIVSLYLNSSIVINYLKKDKKEKASESTYGRFRRYWQFTHSVEVHRYRIGKPKNRKKEDRTRRLFCFLRVRSCSPAKPHRLHSFPLSFHTIRQPVAFRDFIETNCRVSYIIQLNYENERRWKQSPGFGITRRAEERRVRTERKWCWKKREIEPIRVRIYLGIRVKCSANNRLSEDSDMW